MFTTLAHEAAYVFLLTRTNPDVPKHRGLTMFLVPLDAPGVEIHPVHTMGGERTNVTFYSGVRVPDSMRVGDVDGGWDVMTVALTFERGGFALSEADRVWQQTVDWATATRRPDGTRVIDDPLVRERLATMRMHDEVARLLALRCSYVAATGAMPGVEGSMHKLFYAESMTADAAELVDMLGAEACSPTAMPRRRSTAGWSTCTGTRPSPPSTGARARCSATSSRRAASGSHAVAAEGDAVTTVDFAAIDFFRDQDALPGPVPVLRVPPRRRARCGGSRSTAW